MLFMLGHAWLILLLASQVLLVVLPSLHRAWHAEKYRHTRRW